MGWSEVAARHHARRLEREGWLERVPMLRGEGSPLLRDPDAEPVHDAVLFTCDDMHAGTGLVQEVLPGAPGRIRCLGERHFKYARYFHAEDSHPPEHEMYDLEADPYELENLAHLDHPRHEDSARRATTDTACCETREPRRSARATTAD